MHEPNGIHRVKGEASEWADGARGDQFIVTGIGIYDATAARRDAVEPTLVQRLKKDQDGARPYDQLWIE